MSAQKILIEKYGEPSAAYQSKFCTIWEIQKEFNWFPAKKILINKDFKEKLQQAFAEIEKAGIQGEIKTFDGCYNDRSVRGKSSKSLHAWAAAIDLNASTEKLSQNNTHWSDKFISIMENSGVYWGGRFKNRKDNMHFSLLNG